MRIYSTYASVTGSSTIVTIPLIAYRCTLVRVQFGIVFASVNNGDNANVQLSKRSGNVTTTPDVDFLLAEVRSVSSFATSGLTFSEGMNLVVPLDVTLERGTQLYLNYSAGTGTVLGRVFLHFDK